MAKRFIDTKIWDKAWFRKLSPESKLVWIYLLTRCDHAGIWDADWEAAEFFIGNKVNYRRLPAMITDKMQEIDGGNQYFIPSFVEFQYGELRENSKPHLSVIKRLNEKGLHKGLKTPKDKDKAKDKVKNKKKDKKKSMLSFQLKPKKYREQVFRKETLEIGKDIKNITENQIDNFIMYWTESNANGKKMKYEMQRTFDIGRRLIKWRNNDLEWDKAKPKKNGVDTFTNQFKQYKTGLYRAYCSKCGGRQMPNTQWQLKEGSSCCSVEYSPTPILKNNNV
jgi:hypothetical protein